MKLGRVPPDLVESFARGWAQARGLAPPEPDGPALRIESGQPDERRRFIFPNPPDGITALAATINEPLILIKAAIDPVQMATLLPPNWHVDQTGTTMTVATLAGKSPPLRQGLMLQGAWHGPVFAARLIDQDGTEAARGRLTLIDGWALHDTIVVAKSYRRQGLGSAIMAALANQAQASGVRRGLLNATVAGRALYQRLGWTARAPWTTAQIAR